MAKMVIIGPGRMGTALAIALRATGHTILGAYAQHADGEKAKRFVNAVHAPVWPWPPTAQPAHTAPASPTAKPAPKFAPFSSPMPASQALAEADLIVIAVPDTAVTPAARTLADMNLLNSNQIVLHCSGATPHTALMPLLEQGIPCLCMHPLQTVANPEDAPGCFRDVVFTLDGSDAAVARVAQLVRELGGVPERIEPGQRAQYHAAAVLMSNGVVALAAVAAELADLKSGAKPFLPLLQGALQNLRQYGLPDSLTGPVDRADFPTVSNHLEALQNNPTALRIYRALQSAAADVACRKGSLTADQWTAFHDLFDEPMGGMLNDEASDSPHVSEDETSRRENRHDHRV